MRILGFEVTRAKAQALQPVYGGGTYPGGGGWMSVYNSHGEGNMGWFQRDIHIAPERVQSNWAWWSCATLIANDIGKMRAKLVERDDNGIWTEVTVPAFSPVLRKPNNYQTWQQFIECWIHSKIGPQGNTYILKERDKRGIVTDLHVLDPYRCRPLVAENGLIYYELGQDRLARIPGQEYGIVIVPAEEIIHDRTNCLFHPLVGISAVYASGLAASHGIKIQEMSAAFFMNKSVPAGVLTAPGMLTKDLAQQYSEEWQKNYGHGNQGKTAILGNGLVYSTITQNAQESQLTEQLKASAEMVCSTLHVPPYKVGIGAMPVYQNALVLNQIYYDDCLQTLMEAVENLLDDGLGLPDVPGHVYGTELDKDALLRMDEASLTKVLTEQAGGGITSPNEARARLNLGPVKGGESPKMQQQNFSLSALDKRDNLPDPFVIDKPTSNPTPSAEGPAAIADPNAAKMLEDFSANLLEHVGAIHKQVETRLIELDKRTEPQPDAELEGAKLFADLLIRQFETESVCG